MIAFSHLAMSENVSATEQKYFKVVIIGGGMAGLSAANHLISNGMTNFKLLEARGRIGGRIVAINIGSQEVSFFFVLMSLPCFGVA